MSTSLVRVRTAGVVSRRSFGAVAAGAAAAIWAGPRAGPAAAATDITFLGWQGYDEGVLFDDFGKGQGLNLATTYIGNNDEIISKLTTGGLGQVNLVTPYMGYVPLLAKAGLIAPIDAAKVPNLERIMPLFRNDPNINVDGVLYGVPFTWGSGPMMYDPATHPTPPASWMDLLKPECAGKVGMMDDPLGNMMLGAILATDAQVATRLTRPQLVAVIDLLIAMKKQSRVVSVSWGDLADALSRGDVTVTFSGWETIKKFCADKGKVIDYHFPVEGTYAWLDNYCIAKNAPHPDEAHLLCDRIISVPAQKHIAETLIQAIVNEDAIKELPQQVKALYSYGDIEAFGKKARFSAFPPLEPEGDLTTYEEWLQEYERFKTA